MKTIGILGLTPRALLKYYTELNELSAKKFGTNSSIDAIIGSVNLHDLLTLENQKDKSKLVRLFKENIEALEKGGAEVILMTANSSHIYYNKATKSATVPVIHVAGAIQEFLDKKEIKKVALISKKGVMVNNFYKKYFKDKIEVLTPENPDDIDFIDQVIYNELIEGLHNIESHKKIISIIQKMIERGAQAVILGSSEFTYFINEDDISVLLVDSTLVHTQKIFDLATQE